MRKQIYPRRHRYPTRQYWPGVYRPTIADHPEARKLARCASGSSSRGLVHLDTPPWPIVLHTPHHGSARQRPYPKDGEEPAVSNSIDQRRSHNAARS
jgi:hypothetical protein